MLEKSRGIVLHNYKYGESSLISHIFTEKYGRRSFIFKGIRAKRSRQRINLLQPLFIIDLDFYYKETRDLLLVKEFSRAHVFSDFPFNPVKSAQVMFMAEVLDRCLVEEMLNEELFEFLEKSIQFLDLMDSRYSNFHLAFLMKLTKHLGILPKIETDRPECYFDLLEGKFLSHEPIHKDFSDKRLSSYIFLLFTKGFEVSSNLNINGLTRNSILHEIIKYYSCHNYKLENLKSLKVLEEVFQS